MFKRKNQDDHGLKKMFKNPFTYLITVIFMGVLSQAVLPTSLHAIEIETPHPVSGRSVTPESILPADVLARAILVRDELEQIRFKIGKADKRPSALQVQNAAPREVYFQALILLRKSNRLFFEQTGRINLKPKPTSPEEIQPFHVWTVVNKCLKRVLHIKQALNISKKVEERPQADSITPSDVFVLLAQVNRRMEFMLDKPFSPSDVFREVTIGVRYAAELLSVFPDSPNVFTEPPYEEGKHPRDVHQALLLAFEQVENMLRYSGEDGLKINTQSMRQDEITPSEVFDIASILVSELSYFHAQLFKRDYQPFEGYDPGHRVPSHVFQRVGLLRAQLTALAGYVEKKPDWLKTK